jgi:hypothetical protein
LVSTKSAAPVIERSTCDSAAKCTTTSIPVIRPLTSSGSQMSPLTNQKFGWSATDARFASFPA